MTALHPRFTARPLALAAALSVLLVLPVGATVKFGTPAGETLVGSNGKDHLTGGGGNDALQGLAGDDTYHFADGWGIDTLEEKRTYRVDGKKQPGGADTLSFKGVVGGGGVTVRLVPEWAGVNPDFNRAYEPGGSRIDLAGSVVENVVGSRGQDSLTGGTGANRLATAGGAEVDSLADLGGWDDGAWGMRELPASDDTYAGAAANTGFVGIVDWGGAADVLDLRPLRSDEVYLDGYECDGDPAVECLRIVTGNGNGQVVIYGQFGAYATATADSGQRGRIETVLFADGPVTFGGEATRAAGARQGEALLGGVKTKRQKDLATRTPALAREAAKLAPELPRPGDPPADRGR